MTNSYIAKPPFCGEISGRNDVYKHVEIENDSSSSNHGIQIRTGKAYQSKQYKPVLHLILIGFFFMLFKHFFF